MQVIAAVAFDLDDTLAESKSAVTQDMASLLVELANLVPVCVISGGRFEQFEEQLLSHLPTTGVDLSSFHLMPTCGTRYYRRATESWELVYAEDLTPEEKREAFTAIESAARGLGLWEPDQVVHGERTEDRGSQVTYSALGQRAPVARKKAWDQDGSKRQLLRRAIQQALPNLEVRAGGSTSIDVTRRGIDKAYGMRRFSEELAIPLTNILFVGDRLEPDGNDYPVVALGLLTHAVRDPRGTERYVRDLIQDLRR